MATLTRPLSSALLFGVVLLAIPSACWPQGPRPAPAAESPLDLLPTGTNTANEGPWEFTFEGRVGAPTGHLRSLDRPRLGTDFSFNDLGIEVSGAVQGSAAYSFTPRDAARATFLYYFLRGSSTQHVTTGYNGTLFPPGSLDTNADYYRVSLDYERTLLNRPSGDRLVGSAGLTYDIVYPTLTGGGKANGEPFGDIGFRTQIPVPIIGLRWDHPLAPNLLLRTSLSGGGLPRVNSLRNEDHSGTLYLEQAHIDLGLGVVYQWRPWAQIEAGYHFNYFHMRELSHEDDNLFELVDNGIYTRLTVRF